MTLLSTLLWVHLLLLSILATEYAVHTLAFFPRMILNFELRFIGWKLLTSICLSVFAYYYQQYIRTTILNQFTLAEATI